jgi:uncharacterized protein
MPITLRASDTVAWYACRRRFWFDHHPPAGHAPIRERFDELIKSLGDRHEAAVRERLDPTMPLAGTLDATRELIALQTPFIYQPVLFDEALLLEGRPDFLVLQEDGTYRIADAKLARSLRDRPDIKVQIGIYRRLLRSDQPAVVHLGNGRTEAVGAEIDADVDRFLAHARRVVESPDMPQVGYAQSRCGACPYHALCRHQFEQAGDLTLVYGVDSRSVSGLVNQGITNLWQLAERDPTGIEDVPYLKGRERKLKIVAQARAQLTGEVTILRPVDLPKGTYVHFDVESNPLTPSGETEVYLWGLLPPPYDNQSFIHAWSDGGPDQDRMAWETFLDQVDALAMRHPDLRLAHYSNYEIVQLQLYADRYGMHGDARVRRLLGPGSVLFDIKTAVTQSLILPEESYGLKQICKHPKLVDFHWELEESGSQWSVVRYLDYLQESNQAARERIRQEILAYNRDDVKATRALQVWLESGIAGSQHS